MEEKKSLSHYDYERLRSSLPSTWSKEELAMFLVLDCFIAADEMFGFKDEQKRLLTGQQFLIKKYDKYKLFFYIFDKFFLKLYLKRAQKNNLKNILFQNSKHPSIILETRKQYNVGLITQGKRDRLFAFKHFIGYLGMNGLDHYIVNYFKEGNIEYLYQWIKETEDRLRTANPDYIMLRSDSPPAERVIIAACKNLGITTLEIQHGIYNSLIPPVNGKAADYILVWGKYFKDLYIKENIRRPEDIYVLGYPYPIVKDENAGRNDKNYTLCYLAQNFESYDKSLLPIKLENAINISKICKKLGLKFIYRPHPWEDRKMMEEKLEGIEFTAKNEKIDQTLNRADIFVSFSSTSSVEAALRSKVSLQLKNYPMIMDNFEKLGVCSKSFETTGELEKYLVKIVNAPNLDGFKDKFNNDYIETRYNPGQRFLEILKDIESKKNNEK